MAKTINELEKDYAESVIPNDYNSTMAIAIREGLKEAA